jgi:integrase
MSLIQQTNSPYWYSSITIDGKTYRKSLKTTNKKLAVKLEEKHRDELLTRIHLEASDISISKAIEFAYRGKAAPCINLKTWARVLDFNKNISRLSQRDVLTLHNHLLTTMKPSSASYNLAVLKVVHRWAKKQKYQTQDIDFPKASASEQRVRIITTEQEDELLAELTGDCRDLAICLMDTGARLTEITELRWSQINLAEQEIELYRKKVRNTTFLKMTNRMYEVLSQREKTSEFVFGVGGKPISTKLPAIRRALKKIGLADWTIHDLRHAFAAKMIKNGISIYELSSLLGHSSVTTTEIYAFIQTTTVSNKAVQIMNNLAGH